MITVLHNITLIFTFSLHLTTMCLRHPPKIVACVCIHLACKWSNYKIPLSKLKKEWFMHVLEPNWNMDSATTLNLLEELTNEFLTIFEQCPSRLKKKIMASTQAVSMIGLLINRVIIRYLVIMFLLVHFQKYPFNCRPNKRKRDKRTQMISRVTINQT